MSGYAGKRVLVMGLARTGLATARFLLERNADVIVTDLKAFKATQPYGDRLLDLASRLPGNLTLEMGRHNLESFTSADLVVVSPGVPMTQEVILAARNAGVEVISEVELAYRHLQGRIVGITGSNGKTTTTCLVGHILRHAGRKTFVAGNIGDPLVGFVDEDDADAWMVTELSSFQLEGIDRFCCHIAVLLNITPDHMDRYQSFSEYVNAKARIFKNQTSQHYAVVNAQDRIVGTLLPKVRSRPVTFSLRSSKEPGLSLEGEWIVYHSGSKDLPLMKTSEIPLKGMHNVENVMAALAVGLIQGIERNSMIEAIKTFQAVEHRLEWAGEVEGIVFYNDSKATNIDSCVKALQSFDSPILLILGGRNKGGDFGELKDLAADKVKRVFAIGESADEIVESLSGYASVTVCASMREAVERAFQQGTQGDTVLLAPACASFDMFQNYEHRGRVFKAEVQRLGKQPGLRRVH